ncbi:hypothetical protein PV328_004896 [Microctonus aethiopoides]|uniref:Maestro heat-like repeat-containing protein family member 1 n=1 Tax=Microctonus aethiopoides TaxID=144406 RepID=A0AA39FBL5_9HYME|nr:hypothetical protein PV328_004896 [Microctonus aethiopoides]
MKSEVEDDSNAELSAVISALLDAFNDKNEDVIESVNDAIRKISHRSPEIVIHVAIYYFELHRKITSDHAAAILKIMMETLRDESTQLTDDVAISVAELAVNKLSENTEKEASELLVTLSRLHCNHSMGGLLNEFGPGAIPSCAIIRAMGLVASCNPFGTVPFIKMTMSIILPMLTQVHEEQHKHAFCFVLGKFAEAINDYIMNLDEAPDPKIGKDSFSEEMITAFDNLTNNWMKPSRNIELSESILTALCAILPLLPESSGVSRMGKLVPNLLNLCKCQTTRLPSTKVLTIVLNFTESDEVKELLRPYIDQIQQTLFDLVSVSPFEDYRDAFLTHYEVVQCFRAIIILFPEDGLDRILQYLKSPVSLNRARALVIIRHLINTLPVEEETSLQKIALSIQNVLGDVNARQIVGPIVALVAHPTLTLLPSQRMSFIRFIIAQCGITNNESQAYEDALFLLATTVDGAESWLWPCLLKTLLDSASSESSVPLLRALSVLAVKIIRNENCGNILKEFSGTKVLARCLELLAEEKNRLAVVIFLRTSAPLFGHQLKPEWDVSLLTILKMLEEDEEQNPKVDAKLNGENEITNENFDTAAADKLLMWEECMVEFIEKSVELEGTDWATKLAKDLIGENVQPGVAPFLAAVTNNPEHLEMLIHSARIHPLNDKYSRAVGIASKRHIEKIINLMDAACSVEDTRKNPTKLLGLMKDTKAAASAEACKAGLLRCYGEICKKGDISKLFTHLEKHILPWIVKQLNECKEITAKESALFALEQVGAAVHPNRLANSMGLKMRGVCLTTLLTLLQFSTGYKPLQLYHPLLRAMLALLKIPPTLNSDERQLLLSSILDKVIGASTEIELILLPKVMRVIINDLGAVSSEVVGDSADALAELMEILTPWMQSKSTVERRTTIIVLCTTLKSYHNALKYTYPGGKLQPGVLLGRILCWCADPDQTLRSYVVHAVELAVEVSVRHRSTVADNNFNHELTESKRTLMNNESSVIYRGVKMLSMAACDRIASSEVVSLAEGLIEGLLYREENAIAAGIALTQLFQIRGNDFPRSDLYVVDNIIAQMRQIQNASCRRIIAGAIKTLTIHHPEEVFEHLLHQPLPPDRGTEECWKELGSEEECGLKCLEFLLNRLENNNMICENTIPNRSNGKHATASLPSLAAIVALRHLLQSPNGQMLIDKNLAELLTILLKYISGWLYVDAPVSVLSTKFGFIPNREACKLNPYHEVYSVLTNLLTVVDINVASSLLNENSFDSDDQANENLISTVRSVVRCLLNKNDVIVNVAQSLGKLSTSQISNQRAVAIAFYAELIGRIDCGNIWLDAIINTLHEATADSSALVRKLAITGLTRIAYLNSKYIDEYFENCMMALLNGLEEPPNSNGGSQVVLESLRGLSILLSLKTDRPVSPRVVLALKPFVDKDNWEMRLAAISALDAISRGWLKSIEAPDDDVTDHLLGCLPSLIIKLEDSNVMISKIARETLYHSADLLQCEPLAQIMRSHLSIGNQLKIENCFSDLIGCLIQELPQRAEELRNAAVRGYSRSEMCSTRATSVLILGFFGQPRPEDVQRMLQLLRDKDNIVKSRAAKALGLCFTI